MKTAAFKPLINILILLLAITFGCKKRDEKPPLSDENLITEFAFRKSVNGSLAVDVDAGVITGTEIELTVPFGTALELTPTIEISDGATINPASGVPINFEETNPTTYIVTAENGDEQEYKVTVEVAQNTECKIKTFVFEAGNNQGILGKDIGGDITGTDITVTVPFGTDVKALLVATFTVSNGATVTVDGEQQISGETGVDFSGVDGVKYIVEAEDGSTQQEYTVTVKSQPSFATVSYYERENRVGAGDFEKPDLFEISDIAEGSYNYTLKIADKTANGTVEVKDGNGTIGSTLSISDWKSIDDGTINVVLEIEGIDFTYTVTKEQYKIKSWQDLQGMKDDLSGHYTLMNDIELPEPSQTGGIFPEELPKEGFNPLGSGRDSFKGTLDGNGSVIKNFFIDRNIKYVGLIGYAFGSSAINNVGIEISNGGVTGGDYVGGLAGLAIVSGVFAANCYVTGNVTGNNTVGGLVGKLDRSSSVNNCYTTGNVTGNSTVGGLAGYVNSTTYSNIYIKNSYATGDVTGSNYVGGLVGVAGQSFTDHNVTVYRSYATGNVKGTGDDGYAGGLVGRFYRGDIEDSYATGNVEGKLYVGGFFGRLHYSDALVKRCYATGKVTGEDDGSTGGFGGDQGNNSTTNSYWDIASAEQGERSSAGTGVSAASNLRKTEGKYYDTGQDPDAEVFVDWNFGNSDDNPWKWESDGQWPTLYWQGN